MEETTEVAAQPSERHRLTKVGIVMSNKMAKTVVVKVERIMAHGVYGRTVRRSKTFMAHDAANACGIGDRVVIVESRPISRNKRWRVQQVLHKAAE